MATILKRGPWNAPKFYIQFERGHTPRPGARRHHRAGSVAKPRRRALRSGVADVRRVRVPRLLSFFLVVDLIAASNYQAWAMMLDGPQGGHGDAEFLAAAALSLLAGVVVAAVAIRHRRRLVALAAALAVPVPMLALSWCLGWAATHVLRGHYCGRIESPGQCGRCFDGEEQQ